MAVMRTVPRSPCQDCRNAEQVYRKYLRACRWIEQGDVLFLQKILANERDTVETRAPRNQGGDGSLSLGTLTRRRRDIIGEAMARGWEDPGESRAEPTTDLHRRPPCPASETIRHFAPHSDHAYLVGKGPSLDHLTAADFDDRNAPVLATNEAVLTIEKLGLPNPVFGIQQDARLMQRARPENAYWLLSRQAWKKGDGDSHPGAVQYDPAAIGGSVKSLTANQSLRILGIAGIQRVTMLAFDACVTGNCDYADAVESDPNEWRQKPNRFKGYCREIRRVAQYEGIRLAFAPPHDQWTVVCVMRSGGRYTHAHVDWLRQQVSSKLRTKHTFVCLTDQPTKPWHVQLENDWPGWWAKPAMFEPGLFAGGVMYLDLDVVLSRRFELPPWNMLDPDTLYARDDFMRQGEINSSVMLWRGDAGAEIYQRMAADPQKIMSQHRKHGDQEFETDVMRGRIKGLPIRVASYKVDEPDPADTDIVVFHGNPKPWAMKDAPWIPKLHGRGSRRWDFLSSLINERGIEVVAEVGTKEGRTSETILKQCGCVDRLYSIDMFQAQATGNEQGAESYERWDWSKIIADYRRRLEPYRDRCVTLIMDAIEAASLVPGNLGLVFLDADHREDPTREAIRTWRPKVRPGGILAGHDIDWPSVAAAVRGEFGDSYQVGPDNVWYVEIAEGGKSAV